MRRVFVVEVEVNVTGNSLFETMPSSCCCALRRLQRGPTLLFHFTHAGTKWIPIPRRGRVFDLFPPLPCQHLPSCIPHPPGNTDTFLMIKSLGSIPSRWAASVCVCLCLEGSAYVSSWCVCIERERERTYRPTDDDVPLGKINLQIPDDPLEIAIDDYPQRTQVDPNHHMSCRPMRSIR